MSLAVITSLIQPLNIIVCLVIFAVLVIQYLNRRNIALACIGWILISFGLLCASLIFNIDLDGFIILNFLIFIIYLTQKLSRVSAADSNHNKDSELQYLQVQEKERSRIYANLHDDVGAKLLELIYTAKDEETKRLAKEVLNKIRQAVASTENIHCTVEYLVESILNETKLRIDKTSIKIIQNLNIENPAFKLTSTLPMTIIRIIREVISNVIKHSLATTININICSTKELFSIDIIDNGVGMKSKSIGKGLNTIYKRAESISAQTKIESLTGQGVKFNLTYEYVKN